MGRTLQFRTGYRGRPCAVPDFTGRGRLTAVYAHDARLRPGEASAEAYVTLSQEGRPERTTRVTLERGANGRPYALCPHCFKPRAVLYVYSERWESRAWRARVSPSLLACRVCHRMRYASQYGHEARTSARVWTRMGLPTSERAARMERKLDKLLAVWRERDTARFVKRCERERQRRNLRLRRKRAEAKRKATRTRERMSKGVEA